MFGKKRGQCRRRPLREALCVFVGGMVAYFATLGIGVLLGISFRMSCIEHVPVVGTMAILSVLGYWVESGKRSRRQLLMAFAIGLLVIVVVHIGVACC